MDCVSRRAGNQKTAVIIAFVTVAFVTLIGVASTTTQPELDKPIIAHLYADTKTYDGRLVTIYGLVIEASKSGREFLLQDVSQMPLRVVRTDGLSSLVGDQILVTGVFVANGGAPYLETRKIIHTKVLGGGGCC